MEQVEGGYGVRAVCPDCGMLSHFDYRDSSREFGYSIVEKNHAFRHSLFSRVHYRLLRCSGCGCGAVAKFHDGGTPPILESFFPRPLSKAPLPATVPNGISNEYREAELCASFGAWRAASALLRSALEKTLKDNGYLKGTLEAKIDDAAKDGTITVARSQKAHEDIRVLGNEVVHDEWRAIEEAEVLTAMHYAQRILEDFYDDRASVEKILLAKGRKTSA